MEIECTNPKCQHIWDYKGTQKFYATCPKCHYKRFIKNLWSDEALELLDEIARRENEQKKNKGSLIEQ